MRRLALGPAAGLLLLVLTGCGSPDKAALAQDTTRQYWNNVSAAHLKQAYNMLTPGTQAARPYDSYSQDMLNFLTSVASLKVTVGKATVNGNNATVPVALHSIQAKQVLHAYQHLYWQNGAWKIADQDGGLTTTR